MTDHHNKIQSKGRPIQQLGELISISREDLSAAREAIKKYKLRDELTFFKKRNRKK